MNRIIEFDLRQVFLLKKLLQNYINEKDKNKPIFLLDFINNTEVIIESIGTQFNRNCYENIKDRWVELEIIYAMHQHNIEHLFIKTILRLKEDFSKNEKKNISKIIVLMMSEVNKLIDYYYIKLKQMNINNPVIFGQFLKDMVLKKYTCEKIADFASAVLEVNKDLDPEFEEILELLKSMNFDPPNFELSNRQLNEIADSLAYGQKINLK